MTYRAFKTPKKFCGNWFNWLFCQKKIWPRLFEKRECWQGTNAGPAAHRDNEVLKYQGDAIRRKKRKQLPVLLMRVCAILITAWMHRSYRRKEIAALISYVKIFYETCWLWNFAVWGSSYVYLVEHLLSFLRYWLSCVALQTLFRETIFRQDAQPRRHSFEAEHFWTLTILHPGKYILFQLRASPSSLRSATSACWKRSLSTGTLTNSSVFPQAQAAVFQTHRAWYRCLATKPGNSAEALGTVHRGKEKIRFHADAVQRTFKVHSFALDTNAQRNRFLSCKIWGLPGAGRKMIKRLDYGAASLAKILWSAQMVLLIPIYR